MPDDERGWLKHELQSASEEIARWPEWMQRAVTGPLTTDDDIRRAVARAAVIDQSSPPDRWLDGWEADGTLNEVRALFGELVAACKLLLAKQDAAITRRAELGQIKGDRTDG